MYFSVRDAQYNLTIINPSVTVTPIVGLSLVVLVFGYLLSVFRMKYGGYPYRLAF